MNNKEFISELATRVGMTAKDTQSLANALTAEMTAQLEDGNSITIPNFGTFEVRKKLERVMVNPATGQRLLVPPRLTLAFRPAVAMKELVQKGGENTNG
ncbi:MAG: HU family DNA-binding protein [Bacteroidaceae bacterium]|nr:HU family DNA-binding protein [Bacteroidaceae bacterium]